MFLAQSSAKIRDQTVLPKEGLGCTLCEASKDKEGCEYLCVAFFLIFYQRFQENLSQLAAKLFLEFFWSSIPRKYFGEHTKRNIQCVQKKQTNRNPSISKKHSLFGKGVTTVVPKKHFFWEEEIFFLSKPQNTFFDKNKIGPKNIKMFLGRGRVNCE